MPQPQFPAPAPRDLAPVLSTEFAKASLNRSLPWHLGASRSTKADGNFTIAVVRGTDDLAAADHLVDIMYRRRGYPTLALDSAQAAVLSEPSRVTLLVRHADGRAVATLSYGRDGPLGLLADALYRDQLLPLRQRGGQLLEFGRLAIDSRGCDTKRIFAAMLHASFVLTQRQHFTHAVMEVNPRHAEFYQAGMGMNRLGPQRVCARVNAPAVLLVIDLQHMAQQISLHGGDATSSVLGPARDFYRYFFAPQQARDLATGLERACAYEFQI